jgi:hypothetical protein
MSKKNDRTVYWNPSKGWADKRNGASRPDKYYPTQKDAYAAGKGHIENQGGGEIAIKRKDNGQIRDKNTIYPGNDPYPPKG